MRERLAKLIAAAVTGLLVLLAALFAERRNRTPRPPSAGGAAQEAPAAPAPPASTLDPSLVARGRAVYDDQSCARCHSVDGRGNPRVPLDGVGARRTPEELRDWTTAAPPIRPELPGSAQRAKDGFGRLPSAELDALVAYLSSLR